LRLMLPIECKVTLSPKWLHSMSVVCLLHILPPLHTLKFFTLQTRSHLPTPPPASPISKIFWEHH
jgi:hypothetical protein